MLKEKKDFEKEVIDVFKNILEEKSDDLLKKSIVYEKPELVILKENNDEYTSEVRIYFYQKKILIDVLEFFVFFDGHPEATISEFKQWFIEELNSIFQKQKKT